MFHCSSVVLVSEMSSTVLLPRLIFLDCSLSFFVRVVQFLLIYALKCNLYEVVSCLRVLAVHHMHTAAIFSWASKLQKN
uniref:Uncharacterized protein n=1 Tax=Parascaris equorum TaxID=6256 RepID=A0A914RQ97_PAREQ